MILNNLRTSNFKMCKHTWLKNKKHYKKLKKTKTIKSSVSGLPGVDLRAWDLKYFLNQMEHLLNKTHG